MSKRERSPTEYVESESTSEEVLTTGPVALHVSHLSRNVTQEALLDIFGHFGTVNKAVVVNDRKTNLPKGYGFVEFNDLRDAQCALLHMNDGQIDGSKVKVSFVGSNRIATRRDGDNTSSPSRSQSPPKIS